MKRGVNFRVEDIMIKKWNITVPALYGDEVRSAYIYLPGSYEYEINRYYPVLYMFDGHNVFFDEDATYGRSWRLGQYLDETQTDLIVAAVECDHSPEGGRLSEYSPFDFESREDGFVEGRGRLTMEWFINSFKPYIDKYYRTLPGPKTTFIAGSSMGGLMSLYAVLEYNNVFSRAAALSPSLWTAPKKINELIKNSSPAKGTILYMDYGSEEMRGRKTMYKAFARAASLLLEKKVYLDCRIVPGGEHCEESWQRQSPFFIETLMYDLKG